ncbi:ABC transporter permease [Paenibacillus sp. GSMTC-2017]|uniref:ABC transporter permease n=1 Tax=Paenibacillus sp. GSMTC-2017 TaxID=2794350 RepID=UPI0018D7FC9C|nr:ABC transporter permease [Paenibacillus sp. GSMTC-2017]MBH5320800.1 ABC transporter permease [Paenibacillus sp. GSMTC-2017]
MMTSMIGALESGLLYSLMALGVFITYRILDFPDLTVDGSFTTGAAIGTVMTISGTPPWLAIIYAFIGGALAGMCTGLLHTKGKINGLLSGIIMMIALYSINLRILGKPVLSLRNEANAFDEAPIWLVGSIISISVVVLLLLFLKTNMGLSLRATGDNNRMIRSFGANTDNTIILGVALSNALVACSGALVAHSLNGANNSLGIGMIVIGLASVIIGEAIFGSQSLIRSLIAVVVGAIIYRIIYALALRVPWLDSQDMKLITAVIIICALVIPSVRRAIKQKSLAKKRTEEVLASLGQSGTGGAR